MKSHRIYVGIMWLLLAVILPLPLIVLLNNGLVDSTNHLIAYDFGILAYVWWLAIVYLSTRPKWITSKIGVPSTYMMHGMLAIFAIFAATIHKFSSTTFHAIIRNTGNIGWYLEIILIVYAVVFLSGWLSDRSAAFRKLKSNLEKVFNHQLSVWIHRLNFVVIALIWLHVNVIPRLTNVPYFVPAFDVYTLIFIGIYSYQKFIVDADMKNSGVISKTVPLTPDIQEITITLNKHAKNYHAGDFYFVSFREKGISSEPHPFSVVSKPNEKTVSFIIHRVGDFTKTIDQIKVGTKVHLDGPYGLFDSEIKGTDDPIILYGLGTGIAPLLSLAKEYAGKKKIHLIWSTNSEKDYFVDDIEKLADQKVEITIKQHRFDNQELNEILTSAEKGFGQFYVVGSAPVVLKVRENLKKLGIKDNQIHDEHLTM